MSTPVIDNLSLINQQYIPFTGSAGTASGSSSANPQSSAAGLVPGPVAAAANPGGDYLFSQMLEKAGEQAEHEDESDVPVLLGGQAVIDKTSKLFEMCQEFETFLLKTLISSMRNTIQKSDLIDTGYAGQIYEDMLYDEYAKDFAKNAGFGFAEMAYLELTGQRGKSLPRFV